MPSFKGWVIRCLLLLLFLGHRSQVRADLRLVKELAKIGCEESARVS